MPFKEDQFKKFEAFWKKEFGDVPAVDIAHLEVIRLVDWIKARLELRLPNVEERTKKPADATDRTRGRRRQMRS